VETSPGQAKIRFEVSADEAAVQQVTAVVAQYGLHTSQTDITILPQDAPVMSAPDAVVAKVQEPIRFTVSGRDGHDLPVELAAVGVPLGAQFDVITGAFTWTPSEGDKGSYQVSFHARNSLGKEAEKTVTLIVGQGSPMVDAVENAASAAAPLVCSPGSAASIKGHFLFEGEMPLSSRSQPVLRLGGTQVLINGNPAPLLYASSSRIEFLCPEGAPGTRLSVAVSADAGVSEAVPATLQEAAPGVFTVDGSGRGQALAVQPLAARLTAIPNFRYLGNPALAGETVTVLATGIPCSKDGVDQRLTARLNQQDTTLEAIAPSAMYAGACNVGVKVPAGITGDALELQLEVVTTGGSVVTSNTTTIAVGARR
jgi:uncharacterized protein (TIGR03437 family)